jgi:hypothetical protein
MSFMINLIIFALSLTGVFVFFLSKLFRNPLKKSAVLSLSGISEYSRIFWFIQIILLTALVTVLVNSFSYDQRPDYYFVIVALLFANGTVIALLKGFANPQHILILTISIVLISNIVAVDGRNWYVPRNPDQYRDVFVANSIVSGANFSDTQLLMSHFNDYYVLIPALPILISSLSTVTGVPTYLTLPILNIAVSFLFTIGTFLAVRRFGNNVLMGWIAAFIVLSTPRLLPNNAIPQEISIAMISLAFLMLFIRLNSGSRLGKTGLIYAGIMIFLVIAAILYHPSGAMTLLFLLVPIIIFARFIVTGQLNSKLGLLTTIIALACVTYWSYNDLALSSLTAKQDQFFQSFFDVYNRESYVAPNLGQGACDLCAFSWALPYSISAAFLFVQGLFFIRFRKLGLRGHGIEWRNKFLIALIAVLVAIPLAFVGFLSFFADPGAAVERYLSVSTYFLMLIPACLSAGMILNSLRTPYFFGILIILTISVALGSNSPEAAPFENVSSEVSFALHDTYIEVLPLEQYVPAQSRMYIDNDVPKFWYLDRHELDIDEPTSFQTTRDVLLNFANGTLSFSPADQGNVTLFIIKTDRLLNATTSFEDVHLVHSTGIHKVFLVQEGLPKAR